MSYPRSNYNHPSSSDNSPGSRIAGLQLVHDFLRWEQKVLLKTNEEFYSLEKAEIIFRNFGIDSLARYKSQFFDEEPEKNLPRLQFFEEACPIIIETLPMCVYDETRKEDVAEFDGDDPYDNLRYLCKAANRYCYGNSIEIERMRKGQEIVNQLEVHKDMTRFYRQMECLESKTNAFGVVRRRIRRLH